MRTRAALPLLLAGVTLSALTPATAISGGEEVNSHYIVQLATERADGKHDRCTASAISSEWIITAAHCIEDAAGNTSAKVYFSNDKLNPGEPVRSSLIIESSDADLALVKLDTPKELPSYAVLAADHYFTYKERGHIYGYGRGINGDTMPWLRRAEVEQTHEGRNSYWNDLYRLDGIDGTSNNGDSGGPFIVADKLVGINVVGSHVADHIWIGENSGALQLRPYIPWIEENTGITAVPFASTVDPAPINPAPSPEPTAEPTSEPTVAPTAEPTATPTVEPTTAPTTTPTADPTAEPTASPSVTPTTAPTAAPSSAPTTAPVLPPAPSATPTVAPSATGSAQPTENSKPTASSQPSTSASESATASATASSPTSASASTSAPAGTTPIDGGSTDQTSTKKKFALAHTGATVLPLLAVAGALCLAGIGFTLRARTRA